MLKEGNEGLKEGGGCEGVLMLGLNGGGGGGDRLDVFDRDEEGGEIGKKGEEVGGEEGLGREKMLRVDEVGGGVGLGELDEVNVIVKGEVDGCVEGLRE